MQQYYFIPIFITVLVTYFFTLFLVKKKKLALINHRRFWNVILLITFLVSGTLGLILAFFIDQKISVAFYRPFLRLHVEAGIVMTLLSFFHIFWHLPYFSFLFKKKS